MVDPVLTRSGGVVVLLAVVVLAPAARASASSTISPDAFYKLVQSGPRTGLRVEGDIDLGRAGLGNQLKCRDCRFDGDVVAAGERFKQSVDLSGSHFAGKVDFTGASFDHDLLASGAVFQGLVSLRNAHVTGRTDLSEASFLDPALVGGAQFDEPVDLSLASFASIASFGSAVFSKSVNFGFTSFRGAAVFTGGSAGTSYANPNVLAAAATFDRATFGGRTDFDSFESDGVASFVGAEFMGPVNFSQASFGSTARFSDARFDQGGTFVAADFGDSNRQTLFDGVQSDGDLSFAAATFNGFADFEFVDVKGSLSFDRAQFPGAASLHVLDLTAGSYEMSVDSALTKVKTADRPAVLGLIESSAKARGDLGLANDAHYAHEVLNSQHLSPGWRMADVVLYRGIAGYFVRPLHPLLALLALAALITAARARGALGAALEGTRTTSETAKSFGKAYLTTLALIPPGGGRAAERQTRQVEVWIYRILFACALVGFANANPSLSQMLHALG
ncbi:MAG TPA: pentapeptide repeat-containing protein [Gaiellaceae bacterium]|nr:pentapeptide repeat-containing protein [Gaiellaceae bacterium]